MYKFTGKCEYRKKRTSSIIPQSTSDKNLRKTSIKTTKHICETYEQTTKTNQNHDINNLAKN